MGNMSGIYILMIHWVQNRQRAGIELFNGQKSPIPTKENVWRKTVSHIPHAWYIDCHRRAIQITGYNHLPHTNTNIGVTRISAFLRYPDSKCELFFGPVTALVLTCLTSVWSVIYVCVESADDGVDLSI